MPPFLYTKFLFCKYFLTLGHTQSPYKYNLTEKNIKLLILYDLNKSYPKKDPHSVSVEKNIQCAEKF